ncbi:MAG: sugar nucleotide-binding protein [candidate division KSB1 bacterium]|nr:sugar nucleotide-binding protein [candidate division KSB1 bacterium]
MDFVGTIHLGGSERIDRYTFGLKMAHLLGFSASKLKQGSMKQALSLAPRPVDVSLNTTKAQKLLTTRLLNCDEGLKELLKC